MALARHLKNEGDYLSYGEVEHVPGCKCRPSNVLYWELSPAVTDDCPIHKRLMGNQYDRYEYSDKPICQGCGYTYGSDGCRKWHLEYRARSWQQRLVAWVRGD